MSRAGKSATGNTLRLISIKVVTGSIREKGSSEDSRKEHAWRRAES